MPGIRTAARIGGLLVLASLGSTAGCTALSGLDSLEKVQCVEACDSGADGGQSEHPDATTPDGGGDESGSDAGSVGAPDSATSDGAGPTSAYAAAVLADAPLAYWRLDEPSGSRTCADQTGHYPAAVVGTVTFGVTGALAHDPDTAAQFNKSGTVDVGSVLDFPSPAPFSWEVWVKPTSLGNFQEFMSRMTFNGTGNPVNGTYMFAWQGTGMNFGFERFSSGRSTLALDTSGLTAGSWAHVVGTVDASGAGAVWVNGVEVASGPAAGTVAATSAHLVFGAALPCSLDEIAVYDHVLPNARVTAHWLAGSQ
jgi:hypothetical protein